MGSPMGSSRSERFRRRRGKAARGAAAAKTVTTMAEVEAQANPAVGKQTVEQVNPNERLMHIILAQDETINRQMSLLK